MKSFSYYRIALKKLLRFTKAKIKDRDLNNFYGGKSLGYLARKSIGYLFRHGPVGLFRKVKVFMNYGGFSAESDERKFSAKLEEYYTSDEIEHWYRRNKKETLVVIPSYNDFEILSDCIKSLRDFTPAQELHVVIVDDYCMPENLAKLRTLEGDDVTILPRKKNGGYAAAVNDGLAIAIKKGVDAVIATSDVVAKKGWYEALQFGAYNHDENVGLVGPKLLYPDGRIQSGGSFRNPHDPEWFDHYFRFRPENFGPANIPQNCLAVTGAVTYVKLEVLQKIGILGDYPFAFEDVDYGLRAWKAGYKSLYFPDSTMYHMESATRKKNPTISDRERASVVYFWETWSKWFDMRTILNSKRQKKLVYVISGSSHDDLRFAVDQAEALKKHGFDGEVWILEGKEDSHYSVSQRAFSDKTELITELKSLDAIKIATSNDVAQCVWLGSLEKGIPVYFVRETTDEIHPDDAKKRYELMAGYRYEFNYMAGNGSVAQELHMLNIPCQIIEVDFNEVAQIAELAAYFDKIASRQKYNYIQNTLAKYRDKS